MCTCFFSFQNHDVYPFILCFNRDESHERKTQNAHFWEGDGSILAGRDSECGGTWLGINQKGRFGFLTNYRYFKIPSGKTYSRGLIVSDFLNHDYEVPKYMKSIQTKKTAGYNLILGNLNEMYYFSNRDYNLSGLDPGIYGLSNASLDDEWPKVVRGKNIFKHVVNNNHSEERLILELLLLMQDDESIFKKYDLNFDQKHTFLKRRSRIFVKSSYHGTKSTTLVLVRHDGKVIYVEQNYSKKGRILSLNHHEFLIS